MKHGEGMRGVHEVREVGQPERRVESGEMREQARSIGPKVSSARCPSAARPEVTKSPGRPRLRRRWRWRRSRRR